MGDRDKVIEAYKNALILGTPVEERVKKHMEVCTGLNNLYARKNHDYGNSFAQQRLRRKDSILVRLYDKYLRIEQLMNSEAKVKDESIEDTLLDLANYCIMEVVERYIEKEAEYKANQRFAPVCIGSQKDEGGDNV